MPVRRLEDLSASPPARDSARAHDKRLASVCVTLRASSYRPNEYCSPRLPPNWSGEPKVRTMGLSAALPLRRRYWASATTLQRGDRRYSALATRPADETASCGV